MPLAARTAAKARTSSSPSGRAAHCRDEWGEELDGLAARDRDPSEGDTCCQHEVPHRASSSVAFSKSPILPPGLRRPDLAPGMPTTSGSTLQLEPRASGLD